MPDNMQRVGIVAEIASAAAAVVYPLAKVVSRSVERRRLQAARRRAAFAMAVEARLIERCVALERRVRQLEETPDHAA